MRIQYSPKKPASLSGYTVLAVLATVTLSMSGLPAEATSISVRIEDGNNLGRIFCAVSISLIDGVETRVEDCDDPDGPPAGSSDNPDLASATISPQGLDNFPYGKVEGEATHFLPTNSSGVQSTGDLLSSLGRLENVGIGTVGFSEGSTPNTVSTAKFSLQRIEFIGPATASNTIDVQFRFFVDGNAVFARPISQTENKVSYRIVVNFNGDRFEGFLGIANSSPNQGLFTDEYMSPGALIRLPFVRETFRTPMITVPLNTPISLDITTTSKVHTSRDRGTNDDIDHLERLGYTLTFANPVFQLPSPDYTVSSEFGVILNNIPDSDLDGIRDDIDLCEDFFSINNEDLDEDGVGDACDSDADGDGVDSIASGGIDCDDFDKTNFPGNTEILDGKDNNCDGIKDETRLEPPRDQQFWISILVLLGLIVIVYVVATGKLKR